MSIQEVVWSIMFVLGIFAYLIIGGFYVHQLSSGKQFTWTSFSGVLLLVLSCIGFSVFSLYKVSSLNEAIALPLPMLLVCFGAGGLITFSTSVMQIIRMRA